MATVDSLEVIIETKAQDTTKSLNNLVKQLGLIAEGISSIGSNTGLNEFAKKAQEATKNFANIKNTAKGLSNSIAPEMQKVSKSFDEITAKYKDLGKGFKFVGSTAGIQKQIDSYTNAIEKVKLKKQELEAIGKTEGQMYEYAVRDVLKYENILDSLKTQLSSVEVPHVDLSALDQEELDKWFNNLPSIRAEVDKAAQDINNAFDQIEKPRIVNISTKDLEYNADAIKAIYGKASNEMQKFGEKLKLLEIPPIRENNLKKLQNSLLKTEDKLEELRVKLANGLEMGRITESVDDKNYVKFQEQIALTEKQAEALRAKIQEVEQQSKTNWAQSLSNAMGKVTLFAKQAHTSLSRINSVLKRMSTGLNKAVGKLMSLGKSLSHVSKSSKKTEMSLSKAFKMILRYGLGIRSIYTLINKMRRAIVEGFKNLALYSDEVNASISMLKSSMKQFKNAAAAAFAPVLNAIAPALNALIQLCIRATNAINQLLSALTGNDTWIKAKYVYDDVAESIGGAAKAAKGAIRPFDELNNISLPDASGGGTGGINADDMFETLPVENKFQELADKIKSIASQLFEPLKQAWDSQGANVMKSWKYALEEIGILSKSVGSDFFEIWQQPETLSMLENILVIISDIGLIVGHLAENFRKAWEENDTGLHILENIRDIFAVIIANIQNAADTTVVWAANLDFTPLLEAFERFTASLEPVADVLSGILTDFYEQVLLPLGKWTLEKGIPELLDVFTAFNEKVDWQALRDNLSEFWKHLEPFAETVGEGLIIFIERVSDLIANFLNSETFVNFLHDLEDWMDNVTPEDVADGIEKLAKALIGLEIALIGLTALKGLAEFTILMANFGKAIGTIGKAISGSTLGTAWTSLGGLGGILTTDLATIMSAGTLTEIGLTIGTGIIGGIVAAFVGFEIGKEIGKTLFPKDAEWYDNFTWFGEGGFFSSFTDGSWKEALDLWAQDINDSFDALFGIETEPFYKTFGELRSSFTDGSWKEALDLWAQDINAKLISAGNTIKSWWSNDIIGAFSLWGQDISTFWKENIAPWFTLDKWQELGQGILDGISTKWDELKTWWKNTAIVSWWEEDVSPWFTLEKWSLLLENIKTSFISKWSEISAKWKNDITDWWDDNVAPWFTLEKWSNMMSGVIDGFKQTFRNAANAAIEIFNKLIDWINGKMHFEWDAFEIAGQKIVPSGNIQLFTIPHIPKLAKGAVFRGGNPFLAIVNDQKRGQTNVETPLKVIQEALREELQNFSVNFKAAVPKMPDYRYEPASMPSYIGTYGNYKYDASPYAPNGFNSGDTGILGMSQTELYNLFYNATASALNNNKLLNDQKDMVKGILKKPTMEISDVHKAIVKDSMDRGGRIRGGNMMRLAIAEEMYR